MGIFFGIIYLILIYPGIYILWILIKKWDIYEKNKENKMNREIGDEKDMQDSFIVTQTDALFKPKWKVGISKELARFIELNNNINYINILRKKRQKIVLNFLMPLS